MLFWLAFHLFRLDYERRGRLFTLGVLALLAVPLGTFLSAYLLYLLASEKGRRVLHRGLSRVIAATPHIRYRSPWILGIVLIGSAILIPVLYVYMEANWRTASQAHATGGGHAYGVGGPGLGASPASCRAPGPFTSTSGVSAPPIPEAVGGLLQSLADARPA